jgi:hypothetical protein
MAPTRAGLSSSSSSVARMWNRPRGLDDLKASTNYCGQELGVSWSAPSTPENFFQSVLDFSTSRVSRKGMWT